MSFKRQAIDIRNFPGVPSEDLIRIVNILNDIRDSDFTESFDYPIYWGLVDVGAGDLFCDEVDFIQQETFSWAGNE